MPADLANISRLSDFWVSEPESSTPRESTGTPIPEGGPHRPGLQPGEQTATVLCPEETKRPQRPFRKESPHELLKLMSHPLDLWKWGMCGGERDTVLLLGPHWQLTDLRATTAPVISSLQGNSPHFFHTHTKKTTEKQRENENQCLRSTVFCLG